MTNKPIERFCAGNSEVAVWQNQGDDSKIFHSVTAKRTYMDGNGEWKDAGTVHLLPQQIPDMILALQKSHEFLRMGLRQKRAQQGASNDNDTKVDRQPDSDPAPAEQHGTAVNEELGKSFGERVSSQRSGSRRRQ